MSSNCLVFHTSGGISSSPAAFLLLILLSTESSFSRVNGPSLMSNCLLIILVTGSCVTFSGFPSRFSKCCFHSFIRSFWFVAFSLVLPPYPRLPIFHWVSNLIYLILYVFYLFDNSMKTKVCAFPWQRRLLPQHTSCRIAHDTMLRVSFHTKTSSLLRTQLITKKKNLKNSFIQLFTFFLSSHVILVFVQITFHRQKKGNLSWIVLHRLARGNTLKYSSSNTNVRIVFLALK